MTHDEYDGRDTKRRWADVMAELRFLEEHDPAFGETFRQLSWVLQAPVVVREADPVAVLNERVARLEAQVHDADAEHDRLLLAPARMKRKMRAS